MTTHGEFTFATQNGADADRFIYDGPVQTAATLPATAGTTRNICHDTNAGNSTDVGPDYGEDGVGDGYLYTECSSPGTNGDVYTIEFDTVLDASAEQWQFNFYYLQAGPAIGNNQSLCQVEIEENNSGTWIDVSGELGGSGNDTTDGTAWGLESIDLSDGGLYTHAITRVRIRLETQGPTNAWHGDQGVDSITITGTLLADREQDSYRMEDDDGSEAGSTFLALQNTAITRGQEAPFRVRVGMQSTGDPASESATLQVKETSEPATEWRDV